MVRSFTPSPSPLAGPGNSDRPHPPYRTPLLQTSNPSPAERRVHCRRRTLTTTPSSAQTFVANGREEGKERPWQPQVHPRPPAAPVMVGVLHFRDTALHCGSAGREEDLRKDSRSEGEVTAKRIPLTTRLRDTPACGSWTE